MIDKILCITDLDGTFVKNSRSISPDDIQAYQMLINLCDFSVATGRSIKEVEYIVEKYNLDFKYSIGFNGALIADEEKIVFSKLIEQLDLAKLLKYLIDKDLVFDALDGKERIGTYQTVDMERLWGMKLINPENLIEKILGLPIYKVNIRPKAEESDYYLKELKKMFPQLEVFQAGKTRIEVTSRGVSKGTSLKKISSPYNLTVAFGDSGNDISLFQTADISYCMSHAPKIVKDASTYVVDSFSEAALHLIDILENR